MQAHYEFTNLSYIVRMKHMLFILPVVFMMACGTTEKSNNADSVPVAADLKPSVTDIQPHRPNIELTPWDGDLADAIYWRDSRGENIVIVSVKPQYFWADENPSAKSFFPKGEDEETLSELTEVFATHFVLKAGEAKWNTFYAYHDYLFGCCDVYMGYQPKSLQVADADSNGVGEALFMYHETEGDGMISHSYTGTLLLMLDSAVYYVKDETGLGTELQQQETTVADDKKEENLPASSIYVDFLSQKFAELFTIKIEQDRAEVTEQNNVDEHGHADHVH